MYLLFLAWRNIGRNPSRTWGLLLSIGLSVCGLWCLSALVRGLNEQRLAERLDTSLGHIKITHQNFLHHKPAQAFWIFDTKAKQTIESLHFILAYTPRLNVRGSLQNGKKWYNLDVYGIQPEAEKQVLSLYKHIRQGTYLSTQNEPSVVVGKTLMAFLNKKVGDTLRIFLPQMLSLKIIGIYDVPNKDFAKTHIFLPYETLRQTLGLPTEACHQLLLKIKDAEKTRNPTTLLKNKFQNLWVRNWAETAPDLAYLHTLTSYFLGILVLFSIGLLGVLQYILWTMNWQERKLEWQRLKTWGLTRGEIRQIWAWEVSLVFISGIALGTFLGACCLWFLITQGINLAYFSVGLGKMGYSTQLFPVIWLQDWGMIVGFFLILPFLNIFSKK
jgi:ABC-type lipoprotein release transport system permease subunit